MSPEIRYGRRHSDRLRPWRLVGAVLLVFAAVGAMAWTVTTTLNTATDRSRQAGQVSASAVQHALQASQTAVQASQLAQAIQQERRDTILEACTAQNARHDATIRALNTVIGQALRRRGTRRAQRIQIRASRASSALLINALAPKQDCAALVKGATGA